MYSKNAINTHIETLDLFLIIEQGKILLGIMLCFRHQWKSKNIFHIHFIVKKPYIGLLFSFEMETGDSVSVSFYLSLWIMSHIYTYIHMYVYYFEVYNKRFRPVPVWNSVGVRRTKGLNKIKSCPEIERRRIQMKSTGSHLLINFAEHTFGVEIFGTNTN